MIASGDQNQLSSSFAPFRDLLKALMFLSNLDDFNSSPSPPDQGFAKWKGSSKVWKEKGSKWFCHFFCLLFLFLFSLLVCFALLFWVSLVLCIALFFFTFVFVCFLFSFGLSCFSYKNKNKNKNWKYKNSVCMCTLVLVYLGWPLKQSFLNFVSFVA